MHWSNVHFAESHEYVTFPFANTSNIPNCIHWYMSSKLDICGGGGGGGGGGGDSDGDGDVHMF